MTEPSQTARWNRLWARELIGTCLSGGCDHFFVAPGSRSTPLTSWLGGLPAEHVVTHFDERGLAFACLGFGRAAGRAAVLVCTSGTAVANALPAVVEASLEHVPMLLLTADRPPELRAVGANQSIQQVGIFGNYPVWSFDLPCPTDDVAIQFVRSTAAHACQRSFLGPVHLNCMFREPFLDLSVGNDEPLPLPGLPASATAASASATSDDGPIELQGGATIVIAGASSRAHTQAARSLAQGLNAVFLADVTSTLHERAWDAALVTTVLPAAETVIHVGGRIVSQNWYRFLASHPPRSYLHLHRLAERIDPQHLSPCRRVLSSRTQLPEIRLKQPSPPAFRQRWQETLDQLHNVIAELLRHSDTLSEPGIAHALGELVPSGHALFLGNSMPIRDFDQFASWEMEREILVGANRGASGIDGLIASAVGFALGSHRPTTLVIGDLSFLHDMNSLALARKSPVPIVLVVVNNDGGGIFHFLPVADHPRDFERLFAMPHGLRDFSRAAEMFAIPYVAVHNLPDLRRAYQSALQGAQTRILELRTDRTHNAQYHRWLRSELKSRLAAPSSPGPMSPA